jgi:hypothetical protein
MKSSLALLMIVCAVGAALAFSQESQETPVWHKDWPTAQRTARQTGKPVFAIFVCQH